jgi:DNA-binding NtrC family response regulator
MTQDNTHRRRVLVVEDEPVISELCRRMLMAEGFDVDIAMNGSIAKKMVDDKSYDLCLSDIRTPAMDGIQLYQYLEQEHPELARRVIFTTGDVMSDYIAQFLEGTKRPFIPKPFTPDELKQVIRDALAEIDSQ